MSVESELVRKLHKLCAENNLLYLNIKDKNLNGFPDALVVNRDGKHHWLELQREDHKGRVSDIQNYRHAEMKGYKMNVYIVDSIDKIKEILLHGNK